MRGRLSAPRGVDQGFPLSNLGAGCFIYLECRPIVLGAEPLSSKEPWEALKRGKPFLASPAAQPLPHTRYINGQVFLVFASYLLSTFTTFLASSSTFGHGSLTFSSLSLLSVTIQHHKASTTIEHCHFVDNTRGYYFLLPTHSLAISHTFIPLFSFFYTRPDLVTISSP